MTGDAIRDYLSAQLPLDLTAQQHFRLLRAVFALAFAATLAVHVLMEQNDTLLGTLAHATTIGLVYTVAVGVATVLIHALRNSRRHVRVWHVWAISMAGYVLGYYVLRLDVLIAWIPGADPGGHIGQMAFLRLLPVWFLVTYLLVQPYLHESLKSELARLRDINRILESRDSGVAQIGQPIRFVSGRTDFTLDSETIRNIVVEDHYCYVHHRRDNGFAKRDLALPLRDVLSLLPSGFLQVHRSHIVNLDYIVAISRKKRSIRVILEGNYEAPVSRHRLAEVLPRLQQRIAPDL